jgi:hypothetical protein
MNLFHPLHPLHPLIQLVYFVIMYYYLKSLFDTTIFPSPPQLDSSTVEPNLLTIGQATQCLIELCFALGYLYALSKVKTIDLSNTTGRRQYPSEKYEWEPPFWFIYLNGTQILMELYQHYFFEAYQLMKTNLSYRYISMTGAVIAIVSIPFIYGCMMAQIQTLQFYTWISLGPIELISHSMQETYGLKVAMFGWDIFLYLPLSRMTYLLDYNIIFQIIFIVVLFGISFSHVIVDIRKLPDSKVPEECPRIWKASWALALLQILKFACSHIAGLDFPSLFVYYIVELLILIYIVVVLYQQRHVLSYQCWACQYYSSYSYWRHLLYLSPTALALVYGYYFNNILLLYFEVTTIFYCIMVYWCNDEKYKNMKYRILTFIILDFFRLLLQLIVKRRQIFRVLSNYDEFIVFNIGY